MRDRLTKAQVEALLAHVDGSLGRHHEAARVRAGDEATTWDLATELNERRRLAPD